MNVFTWIALALFVSPALAQEWPTRPLRVVVNVAAGGVADVVARLLAPGLGESLRQPVVVENRPGGEGLIGIEVVARADPDGHTLCLSPGSSVVITPHLVRPLDPDEVPPLPTETGRFLPAGEGIGSEFQGGGGTVDAPAAKARP